MFENMVLFLGCKVYCLTFWRCTGFENGRNLVFFCFFFVTMYISLCKSSKLRRSLNSTKNNDKIFLYSLHTVIG